MLPSRILSTLRSPLFGALLFLIVLAAFMTLPQVLHLGTKVAGHPDPFLSMWRLQWAAHALPGGAGHLFDGNIFSPHLRTLAYSDATLVQSALAAPWLWGHANPVLVYNLLLLGGIVTSGLGMFVLVRHLTGNVDAALVSAAIFTLVPYRVEHFMHLELQWTVWMPLSFWAIHRVFESGTIRRGVVAGALLSLQVLSSLYYGAFLGIMVAVLVVSLALMQSREAKRAVVPLAIAAIMAAAVMAAYARPYMENARELGTRDLGDVSQFSAHLASYVTAPLQNWLWGWTASRYEGNELRLFPGLIAVVLALLALMHRPRRRVSSAYVVVIAVAATLSLGVNGPIYRWMYEHLWVLGAFRAPARFSILACCGLAVLAGIGFEYLERIVTAPRIRKGLLVAVLVAVGLECGSGPMYLVDVPATTPVPDVYKFLNTRTRSVVLELPTFLSAEYMYWSATHWRPLVNGYSGYEPPDYLETLQLMRTFPDDEALDRLRELEVRYVLIHENYYSEENHTALMLRILETPALALQGRYRDWTGWAHVFELDRATSARAPVSRLPDDPTTR
jgi:hypothetical protein